MTKAKMDELRGWRGLASTPAQRALLRALGMQDVAGLTRGEAHDLIERRKPGPPLPSPLDAEMDRFLALPYT